MEKKTNPTQMGPDAFLCGRGFLAFIRFGLGQGQKVGMYAWGGGGEQPLGKA